MKTKSLVKLLNRWAHFDADIELADVIAIGARNGALLSPDCIFKGVDPARHPRLTRRKSNRSSREITISHLKSTLCTAYFKDAHEDVLLYMMEILESAARNGLDPARLVGEHKVTFEANQILRAGSWNSVVQMVAKELFRKLENEKKTKAIIQKMSDKLDLGISQEKIDAALPYLELRHLLVHNDGKADEDFVNRYPDFGVTSGVKFAMDFELLTKGRAALLDLLKEFDSKVIKLNVVCQSDLQK
jgi:hypothetical protein